MWLVVSSSLNLYQSLSVLLGHHRSLIMISGAQYQWLSPVLPLRSAASYAETLAENTPQEEAQLQIVFYEIVFQKPMPCLPHQQQEQLPAYPGTTAGVSTSTGKECLDASPIISTLSDKTNSASDRTFSLEEVYAKALFSFLMSTCMLAWCIFHQFFHKRKSDARTVRIEQVLIEQGFKTYKQ